MKCLRCGNTDKEYFYKGRRGWYCRRCVQFKRLLVEEDLKPFEYRTEDSGDYDFGFELTPYQKEASLKCAEAIKRHDVFLYCVCGAGKTEISVESISRILKGRGRVCYAIARTEVVKELTQRFQKIFTSAKVVGVYGGHHDQITGDLIVCTCHQLFRYYQAFDLLIIDEADAFPLKGNEPLYRIALNSCRGHVIFSSATKDAFLYKILKSRDYEEVSLMFRPSLKPLVEPRLYRLPLPLALIAALRMVNSDDKQWIIFVPSRKICELMYRMLKRFMSVTYAHSALKQRDENIQAYKRKEYRLIVATSVLERGVTIYGVNVIILDLIEGVYDASSMIQMAGRVGRDVRNPTGTVAIISSIRNEQAKICLNEIKEANRALALSIL